jgi:hypothetical protein
MAKFKFIYEGMQDQYERGRKIEISFGGEDVDGLTTYEVVEQFGEFLKAVGYSFKELEVINNRFDSELGH